MKTPYQDMVTALVKPGEDILKNLSPEQADLWHMATGVSGEVGELLDAVKKHVIYRKPLDRENIIEELGDLEFYMERIRQIIQISRSETLKHNMKKLLTSEKARYKMGVYTDAQAINRNDKVGNE